MIEGSDITSFRSDWRLSNTPAIIALVVVGLVLGIIGGKPTTIDTTLPISIALLILALATWFLNKQNTFVASGFLNIGLLVIITSSCIWIDAWQPLILLALLPLLSLSQIGTRFAITLVIASSTVILVFWWFEISGMSGENALITLLTITTVFLISLSDKNHTQDLISWSWENYQRSLALLTEARYHRADLMQTTKELAHATQQLSLMNEKLDVARHIAEEAQKAKSIFVSNVSHEFRTPLNMIIGLIDLVMENPDIYGDPLPKALLDDIGIVQRNCEHLSSMINDVLDLSQVEAGRISLHKERVDLLEVVQRAVIVVKPLLDKKKLYFSLEAPPDLSMVYCDRTRILQVVVNLLGNAARFTDSGGILVNIQKKNNAVVVKVTDTGPGIKPDDLKRLFEPFSQGALGASSYQTGSGLGLAISKQFVELLGGKMWAESELGLGSSFYFRLPVVEPVKSEFHPQSKLIEDWTWYERVEKGDLSVEPLKRRVVLYDSTCDLYPLLSRYMDEFEIVETKDIEQAIEECRLSPKHALIINIPEIKDLVQQFEKIPTNLSYLPIIGFSFPPRNMQAQLAGAISYIIKPVNKSILKNHLQTFGKPIKRLLLVDDHPDELMLLKRMLHTIDNDIEVDLATNGEESLERLHSKPYDLLLLDIVMPDMDGWKVLTLKNQDPAIRDIPTFILSGKDPLDTPISSKVFLSSVCGGLSLSKAIKGFQALSSILLQPD